MKETVGRNRKTLALFIWHSLGHLAREIVWFVRGIEVQSSDLYKNLSVGFVFNSPNLEMTWFSVPGTPSGTGTFYQAVLLSGQE